MVVQVVLFDIDGTLVDSNEQHVIAWALALREEGYPQEVDAIRARIGKGGDLLVPALVPNADDAVRKRISERHGTHFKSSYLAQVRAFDGASDLVRKVHASGRKVMLASSAKRDELDRYFGLLGIETCLSASTNIDDVGASMPEPDIFSVAPEKVGCPPESGIVVGDTIYDVTATLQAGISCIGLTSGPYDERQLKDAGASAVFTDVAALLCDFDHSPLAN